MSYYFHVVSRELRVSPIQCILSTWLIKDGWGGQELVAPGGFRVARTKIAPRALMETAAQEGVVFVGDAFAGMLGQPSLGSGDGGLSR